jgi:hypothetical protein
MARFLFALIVGILGLGLTAGPALSQKKDDKKPEKKAEDKELKGTACCAKCELKDKDFPKCQTVLLVKEDGKEVKYYFDAASEKKHHSDYCNGKTDVTVKGKITEKDGKKWVEVTSVEKKKP